MNVIDLRSDTKTRPTPAMRKAMVLAPVGDEQKGEDPTVCALEERVAALLGKEAGVFLPSGTMCNLIAIHLHIRPGGDEIILERNSHPVRFEAGGAAALAGASMQVLNGEGGIFQAHQVESALRPKVDLYAPRSRLVCIEQTTNLGGGRIWPLQTIKEVLDVCAQNGLRSHLDGARLLNASVAFGIEPSEFAKGFDTAWLDLSKGLGAPLGAVLCGDKEAMAEARRYKQMFGGGMRQAGIIAAGGLFALEEHVERLAEDHERAKALAHGLSEVTGVKIDPSVVETNIVIFEVNSSLAFCKAMEAEGILMGPVDQRRVRAVTHLDIDSDDIKSAISAAHSHATGH